MVKRPQMSGGVTSRCGLHYRLLPGEGVFSCQESDWFRKGHGALPLTDFMLIQQAKIQTLDYVHEQTAVEKQAINPSD